MTNIFSHSFYMFVRIACIVTFAIFFWILKDVNAIISRVLSYGYSYLYRYHSMYYQETSLSEAIEQKDFLYHVITFIFNYVGISFESFLFLLICIYCFVFVIVFNKLIKQKNFFFDFFLLVILSFWLDSLLLVALRQGFAFIILFSLLFRKYEISLFEKLIIVLIASSIHFSIIIILPLILFEKILINKTNQVEIFFILIIFLYFVGFFSTTVFIIYDIFNFFEMDLRALQITTTDQSYKTGFSFYKFLAIFIPFLLYKLSKILNKNLNNISLRIYLYFLYVSMVGIFLSGFMYHDRIMLLAWAVSPILICYSLITFIKFYLKTFKI